jgi:hypothetical protein
MATFSDDFSTHTAGTIATVSAPTAISGWTAVMPASSAGHVSAEIVTDAGAIGGKIMRLKDWNGSDSWGGGGKSIVPTTIGNVSSNVATEILVSWKIAESATFDSPLYPAGFIRQQIADPLQMYYVGLDYNSGGAETLRLWYYNAGNEWSAIGASKDIASTYTPGDWMWVRLRVSAAGGWLWKSWEQGDSEPGSWQNSEASDTTFTAGYSGVGCIRTGNNPIDYQWFSMGTSGDAAPSPSGGDSEEALSGSAATGGHGTASPVTSIGL